MIIKLIDNNTWEGNKVVPHIITETKVTRITNQRRKQKSPPHYPSSLMKRQEKLQLYNSAFVCVFLRHSLSLSLFSFPSFLFCLSFLTPPLPYFLSWWLILSTQQLQPRLKLMFTQRFLKCRGFLKWNFSF